MNCHMNQVHPQEKELKCAFAAVQHVLNKETQSLFNPHHINEVREVMWM